MANENSQRKPDMQKVVETAISIVCRASKDLTHNMIHDKIEEILFGPRKYWECAESGSITKEELADVILAHLDTLVENFSGKRFYDPNLAVKDNSAMLTALFGSQ